MAPPKAVIHINFVAGALSFDPRHIWTALRNAELRGRIARGTGDRIPNKLGDLAIHIGTRDYLIRRAVREFQDALAEIYRLVPDPRSLPERHGYRVISSRDSENARDRVLLTVDSFLFELRAYLDLVARFTYAILKGIGHPPPTTHWHDGRVLTITKGRNLNAHALLLWLCDTLSVSTDWYSFLASHRNFFTHKGAPYCAVEDRLVRPPEFDLLIMRTNIHDFTTANSADFFRASECQQIVKGVRRLGRAIQEHLVATLETL